jgi:taurine dioxygenase
VTTPVPLTVTPTSRYGWQPGDFVTWDNQATWHFAIDDYGSGPRVYRKVIGV